MADTQHNDKENKDEKQKLSKKVLQPRWEAQMDKHFIQSQGNDVGNNIVQKRARPLSNPFVMEEGSENLSPEARDARIVQRRAMSHENPFAFMEKPVQMKTTASNTDELPANDQPIQRVENKTGMPDNLKSGIESLSGMDMSDVKVHYNSDKPAQLQAHAYAQGTDIHLASGQEKHLAHEAWHVVQQKQGRVQATTQMKSIGINDDSALENEADVMGAKALQMKANESLSTEIMPSVASLKPVVQGKFVAKDKEKTTQEEVDAAVEKALQTLTGNGKKMAVEIVERLRAHSEEFVWDTEAKLLVNVARLLKESPYQEVATKWFSKNDPPLTWLSGEYSATKKGNYHERLAAWDIVDRGALNGQESTELAHASSDAPWMSQRIDTTYGSEKGELGQGFYTVTGHEVAAAEGIRDEFSSAPRDVLKFRIANKEIMELVGGNEFLGFFLIHILQHSAGYPAGMSESTALDCINWINAMGDVLIFPDKKTPVFFTEKETLDYEGYRKKNGGGSNHSIIIAPQAPESIANIRQVCLRGSLGDRIINEALRSQQKLAPKGVKTGAPAPSYFAPASPPSQKDVGAKPTGKPSGNKPKGSKAKEESGAHLIHINNCLIDAISNAALGRNPTLQELTAIRGALANAGQMMVASELTVGVIRQALGITHTVIVRYPTNIADVQDETFQGGAAAGSITVYHTGRNHFQHTRPAGRPYNG